MSEPKYFICVGGRGNGRSLQYRLEMVGNKPVIIKRKGVVYMKDYDKVIKELQTMGGKLSDEGNHEIGNILYLAGVDMEDLWTMNKALSAEIKKLQEVNR